MSRTDNFDRANGAIGTPSDGGSAWVVQSGTWQIAATSGVGGTGAAYESAGTSQATCVLEASDADVDVQVTLLNATSGAGLVARASDDSNYLLADFGSVTLQLYKRVAGSFTAIGSPATVTAGSADVFKLSVSGSTINLYQNGTLRCTATDSFNSTATRQGIRAHNSSGLRYDDFSITTGGPLVAGTVTFSDVASTALEAHATASGGTLPYTYKFQRAPDVSGSAGTYADLNAAGPLPAFDDSGLAASTPYWYRVVVADALAATATGAGAGVTTTRAPATYYVSPTGSDAAAGTSSGAAWQTAAKVVGWAQVPGDTYRFEGGQTFSGTVLALATSGAKGGLPITFGSYGTGKATLSCGSANAITLTDCSWVTVQDLIVAGVGVTSAGVMSDASTSKKYAVDVKSTLSSGWLGGIRLLRLSISGCYGGVFVHADAAATPVGFDGLEIGGTRADPFVVGDGLSFGIFVYGSQALANAASAGSSGSPYYLPLGQCHSRVHVHDFKVSNVYGFAGGSTQAPRNAGGTYSLFNFWGSGIVVANTAGWLVESGRVTNTGKNNNDDQGRGGPVGAWAFESTYGAFRFVESDHNLSVSADGGGFDLDGGCQDCVVEYCYAHDNFGAGYQSGSFGGSNPCSGNTVRYCVSEKDAGGGFRTFNTSDHILVHNCTFYNTDAVGTATLVNYESTTSSVLRDCILVVSANKVLLTATVGTSPTVVGNHYWSAANTPHWSWQGTTYTTLATFRAAPGTPEVLDGRLVGGHSDPLLASPGGAGTINNLTALWKTLALSYALSSSTPAVHSGVGHRQAMAPVPPPPSDFAGNRVLVAAPTPGAFEAGSTAVFPSAGAKASNPSLGAP